MTLQTAIGKVNKSYRDLAAWQKAILLVEQVYRQTDELPDHEKFGLRSQLRRAAVSVPSNIAEGSGRHATQEYIRFLRIARGSVFEIETQVEIAARLGYRGDWNNIVELADEVSRILAGLIRAIETKL